MGIKSNNFELNNKGKYIFSCKPLNFILMKTLGIFFNYKSNFKINELYLTHIKELSK